MNLVWRSFRCEDEAEEEEEEDAGVVCCSDDELLDPCDWGDIEEDEGERCGSWWSRCGSAAGIA